MKIIIKCFLSAICFTVVAPTVNASSSFGCNSVKPSHYTTPFISQGYNSKVSWHLKAHKVTDAWALSQGDNVTVGQIDTGIDKDQQLLTGSYFNTGLSGGRFIERKDYSGSLSIGGWGHGTEVASVIVAPVNNKGGMTGVAYKSDIVSYRANEIPALLSNASVKKFNNALRAMADRPDVRIINISMGKLKNKDSMEDAIRYAYNKGKLIFASTGITGENGGVYPAKYNAYVQAVTGVLYRESDPNGFDLQGASPNPFGTYVDFAVYVKRPSDDACVLMADNKNFGPKSGVGSSLGAATMSGIAALVWSANPQLTREQVVEILRRSGSYANSPDQDFGYGVVDAERAVELAIDTLPNNKARNATVTVNSTYPGYSASKVNDGSRNTTVGPNYSWANNSGTSASSQDLHLNWSSTQLVSRIVLYTSEGYELKDFNIWLTAKSSSGATISKRIHEVRNNTASRIDTSFTPLNITGVKIEMISGPSHQSNYVRVNEIEVY